jgi:hypothetical protein
MWELSCSILDSSSDLWNLTTNEKVAAIVCAFLENTTGPHSSSLVIYTSTLFPF